MSAIEFQRIQSMVGDMLVVHRSQESSEGEFEGFRHVLLDGRNFQVDQRSQLFTRQGSFSERLKSCNRFTYIDHEGGRVHRFNERVVAALPSACAIRLSGHPQNAYVAGDLAGQQLSAMGVTMSLGPVVDIGPGAFPSRCFGSCAQEVIEYAGLYLEGLKKFVLVCLKRWPGHGAVIGDSHHLLPHATGSLESLSAIHELPFIALAKKTNAIMTAHIVVDAQDPVSIPTHPGRHSPNIGGLILLASGYKLKSNLYPDVRRMASPML